MQEIRILHLEDDPSSGEAIANLLREPAWSHDKGLRFSIRRAANLSEFESELEVGRFDLILSDHGVPGGNGMHALDFCRVRFPSVPFLFLSARSGSDLADKVLQHGAADYILKNDMARFVPSILRALKGHRESAALREAQARIRRDQANLRALIENTADAVWSMDLDFGILIFNSAASLLAMKLSGQPMTVGGDFLQHLPVEAHERWRAASLRVRNRERFREDHGLSWNGTGYAFDMSFNPVSNDGVVIGMAVFGREQSPMARPPSSAITPAAEPMRILVVEDNPVNQMVLKGFLERLGYSGDTAYNGIEAMEAFRKAPYDLVFMDCWMPIMDGFAAARAIREEEASTGGHAWIVAITADVSSGIRERCLIAGMDGYISKPFPMDTLKAALEDAVRHRKARLATGAVIL